MKIFILLTVVSYSRAEVRNTVYGCEGSTVELTCPSNKVINIVRANYGRISSSICVNNINGHESGSWSTRCIQPTSLRTVSSVCGDERSECSVSVDDGVFGDPCPHTPKYLELVYTCQQKNQRRETPSLPAWLLSLEAISNRIMEKTSTTSTTESTTVSTTTEEITTVEDIEDIEDIVEIVVVESNEVTEETPLMRVRQPSTKFLRYLEQMKMRNEENRRISLMLNNPRVETSERVETMEESSDNLYSAIIIAVLATILLLSSICVIICCRNNKNKMSSASDSDVESTSSSSAYLSYSNNTPRVNNTNNSALILGKDGKLYQQVFINSSILNNQSHAPFSTVLDDKHEYAEISSNYQQYFVTPHKM